MSPRKYPQRKPSLSLPEKCRTCPIFLDAQADAEVNEGLCHFGFLTPEQIAHSRQVMRDAGYDAPLSDAELLSALRARAERCLGAVTLRKTVGNTHYQVVVCGSTEATVPAHHQGILFEPATVKRTLE